MTKFDYIRARYLLYCLFHRNGYDHAKFLKRHNVFHSMGENCFFQPYNLPADAKFIQLGNNVVISSNVRFICHDVINYMLNHIPETRGGFLHIGESSTSKIMCTLEPIPRFSPMLPLSQML